MGKENTFYLFGKDLTTHLASTPSNKRYLEMRIERFTEEFLNSEVTFDQLETVLSCVHDYLADCEDSPELGNTLINLRQSIFWLHEYSEI